MRNYTKKHKERTSVKNVDKANEKYTKNETKKQKITIAINNVL